jgi:phosphoglycerate dehydrogenase-like enzyme
MPQKDRLETLIEQVEKLTSAVAVLAEHQVEQAKRTTVALEAHAAGLVGIGKLGSKVGALATAMDQNLAAASAARQTFVSRNERILAEIRDETGRIGRTVVAEAKPTKED